jgi:hypothetical protein
MTFLLLGLSLTQLVFAQTPPVTLECRLLDSELKDQVFIQWVDSKRAKFYYLPADEAGRLPSSVDWTVLNRINDDGSLARFQIAQTEVTMTFALPSDLVQKPSRGFEATLTTEIHELHLVTDQALSCKTKP